MLAIVLGVAHILDGRAHADELGRPRPPVRLELGACLDGERDAIQRAVRIELGEDAPGLDDAGAVVVQVECADAGAEAGVVLEVRPPGSPRHYRYALDWRAQPLDARPRLIGLAVAEAVDASRMEPTAVPERPTGAGRGVIAVPAPLGAAPGWTLALAGDQRTFSARGGVALLGIGVVVARPLSTHLRVAADVVVDGATALASSGLVVARAVSCAPRLVYRAGGRLHGELGVGARVGVVRLAGEALPNGPLVGGRLVRAWFGPAAFVALGAQLTRGLAVSAVLELGVVSVGATARELGAPVASVDGAWRSLGLAAVIAL